jgi:hypothetical protein
MTCQTDRHGRPKCHITAHPDHPDRLFCSTCGAKVRKEHSGSEGWPWIIPFIFLALILL